MYDYVNFRLPEAFDFTWLTNWQDNILNEIEGPELRNNNDFRNVRTRYVYLDSHPLFDFYKCWNELPADFKLIDSRTLFAKKIKKMLFEAT